jgi:hypothetical protein
MYIYVVHYKVNDRLRGSFNATILIVDTSYVAGYHPSSFSFLDRGIMGQNNPLQ